MAFDAMVSIATIGLYIAYALPIFFRVTLARKSFAPGPFNLGRYGVIAGWVAVLFVVTIFIAFSLPVSYPVTIETLNYAPVAFGCLLLLVVSYWIFSGRHWFRGPIANNKQMKLHTYVAILFSKNMFNRKMNHCFLPNFKYSSLLLCLNIAKP